MAILEEDYITTLDLLAGWDPEWDEGAIKVNGVPCLPRSNLIQLIQDNIEARTSVYEILRRLLDDNVIQPARMTSRKNKETGEQKSFLTHEIIPQKAAAIRAQYLA